MYPCEQSIRSQLAAMADAEKAPAMQRYMKTDQPFLGVQAPSVKQAVRAALKAHPPETYDDFARVVRGLWRGPHREEQYAAIRLMQAVGMFQSDRAWPLYEELLRSAVNWDLVDPIASPLLDKLFFKNRKWETTIRSWITDETMWVRRAAIICQLRHKDKTDTQLLGDAILQTAAEKEFFIRKGAGWALRQYSYTNPRWVREFVGAHEDVLSNLTKREAMRVILKKGW